MSTHSALDSLLAHARRRVLAHLILDKAALALAIVMGGAILLLILGTQILDWYWLVILAAAGLGAGLYQLRGRIPSLYEISQGIDRRLHLADTLSTAFYFTRNPDPQHEAITRRLERDSESAAAGVNLTTALPYTRSRFLLPAAVLALAAAGLFTVRYAATGSINLKDSLFALASDTFFPEPVKLAQNDPRRPGAKQEPFTPGSPDAQNQQDNPEDLPESLLEPPADQQKDGKESAADNGAKDKSDQGKSDQKGDNQQGDQSKQDESSSPDEDNASNSKDPGKQDGKESKPADQSMMDKIRDALANVLNKMKSESSPKQQNSQNQKSQKSDDSDKQQSDKNDSGESSTSDAGQKKDQANKQQGDAKGGENPDKPENPEASNSMGDKVGSKAVKDAQALEAMGKITELLGKRSATLTGEMMVEVGSTKQNLKTQFTTKDATHTDTGGEIHRDEVPLMYQQFVEQYFEEIRKTPAGGAKAPKK